MSALPYGIPATTGAASGPAAPGALAGAGRARGAAQSVDGASFREQLDSQLHISRHAARRMESRGVSLDSPALDRLSTAVEQAEERGSRESLILMDGVAFVVSVPNRTVITAHKGAGDRVYTNIDSTIVLGMEDG